MDQPISRIMVKSVFTVDTEDTIERVDDFLNTHKLSSIPVVDAKGVIFGILSAPYLVRFHAAGKNPRTMRAWKLCTYKPIEVGPATPAGEVARLMVKNRIHHVVVTENGLIKGFVSSLDFLEHYVLMRK
jgi:CBS domain-containing protein